MPAGSTLYNGPTGHGVKRHSGFGLTTRLVQFKTGDSMAFDAEAPHLFRNPIPNPTDASVEALVVISTLGLWSTPLGLKSRRLS